MYPVPDTSLRQKHKEFSLESVGQDINGDELKLEFNYKIGSDLLFSTKLTIPLPTEDNHIKSKILNSKSETRNTIIQRLAGVESLSYWKLTASPKISFPFKFAENEENFWHDLLIKGMGEYFYQNKIDFTAEDFVTFTSLRTLLARKTAIGNRLLEAKSRKKARIENRESKILIPIGGGKDSIVTLELLKKNKERLGNPELILFALNPTKASQDILDMNPDLQHIVVKRELDPKILELNEQGFYNGHIPFSAVLAFMTTLVAELYNIDYIFVSNESSANEGNTEYLGQEINHQYSKSFDFEKKFRKFARSTLGAKSEYLSFLRPLNELQIAKTFSQIGQDYFAIFRSCNRGQKQNAWCHSCAKCLFAFVIFFPFIKKQVLISKIFERNLFEDESLLDELLSLVQIDKTKPWDCVGTREEVTVALHLAVKKYESQGKVLPVLLDTVKKLVLDKESDLEKRSQKVLSEWNKEHNVPDPFHFIFNK